MRELTIALDDAVYDKLTNHVGPERVVEVLTALSRDWVPEAELEADYAAMAADEQREREALEWSEGTIQDFGGDDDWPAEWRQAAQG